MLADLFSGIVPDSDTRVKCVFCKVDISKDDKSIEEHVDDEEHKSNFELASDNGIYFNEVLNCKPCQMIIQDEESLEDHLESENHSNWMTALDDLVKDEFIDTTGYLSLKSDNFQCEACTCDIGNSLLSIEEHVNNQNHRVNIVKKLKPLNGIFPTSNDGEVWCKLCDIHIENSVDNLLEHIDCFEDHVNWFADIDFLIEMQDITIENYLANEFEPNAYCKLCDTGVKCDPDSLEEHVYSTAHINCINALVF